MYIKIILPYTESNEEENPRLTKLNKQMHTKYLLAILSLECDKKKMKENSVSKSNTASYLQKYINSFGKKYKTLFEGERLRPQLL